MGKYPHELVPKARVHSSVDMCDPAFELLFVDRELTRERTAEIADLLLYPLVISPELLEDVSIRARFRHIVILNHYSRSCGAGPLFLLLLSVPTRVRVAHQRCCNCLSSAMMGRGKKACLWFERRGLIYRMPW